MHNTHTVSVCTQTCSSLSIQMCIYHRS